MSIIVNYQGKRLQNDTKPYDAFYDTVINVSMLSWIRSQTS